jgi:hypothetical protein
LRKADESAEFAITEETADLSDSQARPSSASQKGARHLAFQRLFAEPFGRIEVVEFERGRALEVIGPRPAAAAEAATSPRDEARRLAPWIAGGSAIVGGSMTLWALERKHAGETAPQRDRAGINDTISRLNTVAVVAYAAAATAAVTWAVLSLWSQQEEEGARSSAPALR